MSWVFYFMPDYNAPFRSGDIKEGCVLAYDYFSMILDDFVGRLPKDRQLLEFTEWLAGKPTLADRVHLIFPNGFGEYDEEKNHNPTIWPVFLGLSEAVHEGGCDAFAKELCESWDTRTDFHLLRMRLLRDFIRSGYRHRLETSHAAIQIISWKERTLFRRGHFWNICSDRSSTSCFGRRCSPSMIRL